MCKDVFISACKDVDIDRGFQFTKQYVKIQHNRERKRGGVRTTYLFDDDVVEEDVVVGEGVGGADSVGDDVAALAVLTIFNFIFFSYLGLSVPREEDKEKEGGQMKNNSTRK